MLHSRIAAELLRMMITGDHPVDLKLTRFCVEKLCCEVQLRAVREKCWELADHAQVIDQACLFNAPGRLLRQLRTEALHSLNQAEAALTGEEQACSATSDRPMRGTTVQPIPNLRR